MNQQLVHVYFVPGMAANTTIFEHIKLPENIFKTHYIPWKLPKKKETIEEYAKRMCAEIKHENPVLIGVSFGGIMVQEMAKQIAVQKVLIISSVKTKHELPKRMKLAKITKAYKLIPTRIMANSNLLTKFAFGKVIKKRIHLYKKYISMNNTDYLDWAIEQIVMWKQDKPISGLIHIHGENDGAFPVSHIKNYIKVEKGTHIMIINRPNWFNEHLPELILTGTTR